MNSSENRGIIRKTDDLGRVVLPIEYRKKLNINKNEDVEMLLVGETIVLKKPVDSCIKCGKAISDLAKKIDLNLCDKCVDELDSKIKEAKSNK